MCCPCIEIITMKIQSEYTYLHYHEIYSSCILLTWLVHMVLYEYDMFLDRCCNVLVLLYVFGTFARQKCKTAPVTRCHRCVLFYEESRLRYVKVTLCDWHHCLVMNRVPLVYTYTCDLWHYNNDMTWIHGILLKIIGCPTSCWGWQQRKCWTSQTVLSECLSFIRMRLNYIPMRWQSSWWEKKVALQGISSYNADHHYVTLPS